MSQAPRTIHEHEPRHDPALIRELLRSQFPEWAQQPIRYAASQGTSNALYRIGDEFVVRLPRVDYAVASIQREVDWLPQLAPQLSLAVPEPVALGSASELYPWPWSVYRWLPGESLRSWLQASAGASQSASQSASQTASQGNLSRLAETLGEFIAQLHRIPTTNGPASNRGGPLESRDQATRTAIEQLVGKVDTDRATQLWQESLQVDRWFGPALWSHGDLLRDNLLMNGDSLSAVIDFGGVGIGDPACDLIPAWSYLPASTHADFLSATGLDEATWLRGRGWALSVALIIIPYYENTESLLTETAYEMLHKIFSVA